MKGALPAFLAAAAIVVSPASPVLAGNDVVGAIIGGMIGSAIANSVTTKRRTVVVRSKVSSAQRQHNREIQSALNYFGFPAGTVDGVLGRRSRTAIAAYQAYLGMPATGKLTEIQDSILIAAYQQATEGAPETLRLISRDPEGPRTLLRRQQQAMIWGGGARRSVYAGLPVEVGDAVDEIAATSDPTAEQLLQRSGFIQLADLNGDGDTDFILDTSYSGSNFWCGANGCKTMVFLSSPDGYARNDFLIAVPTPASFSCEGTRCMLAPDRAHSGARVAGNAKVPEPEGHEPPAMGLGVFSMPVVEASLSTRCTEVGVVPGSEGLATARERVETVLEKNLCLTRGYAIDAGTALAARIPGLTDEQIARQCASYGEVLSPYIGALARQPRAQLVADLESFVKGSGIREAELETTATICLAHGYRIDDMDIALGSAMVLVALGRTAYGELPAHHLALGFGVPTRSDLAIDWYETSLAAEPVFAPAMTERPAVLRNAVARLRDGGAGTAQSSTRSSGELLSILGATAD